MKATKKIVGAACALVAAVALSAGSTFAWFSTNAQVTVTGMQVQAVVPDNLYIKRDVERDPAKITETSVDFGDTEAHKLNPAKVELATTAESGATNKNLEVKEAITYSTDPSATQGGVATAYDTIGTMKETDRALANALTGEGAKQAANYAAKYTFSIVRLKEVATGTKSSLDAEVVLTFNTAVTGADADTDKTWKFIRTGFYVASTDTTNSLEATWVSIENTAATLTDATGGKTLTFDYSSTDSVIKDVLKSNTAYVITLVVYFDGDDTDCFVNNAQTTNGISVQATFTVTDTDPTPTPST